MSTDDSELSLAEEDATAMFPPCEAATAKRVVSVDEVEGWEETTQVDEPIGAVTMKGAGPMGLALPAPSPFDDDDDEFTDYALIIEPLSPVPTANKVSTPPLVPQQTLPMPLPFRANLGTTPPPKIVRPVARDITWRASSQVETVTSAMDLQRPSLGSSPSPQLSARLDTAIPRRKSRKGLAVRVAIAIACGAGVAALLVSQEQVASPPVVSTKVIAVPVFIPLVTPHTPSNASPSSDELQLMLAWMRGQFEILAGPRED